MIELLLLLLSLSMVLVNESERLTSAIFTVLTIVFYSINYIIPDNLYYVLAALYDLMMMGVMYLLSNSTNQKLTKYICFACFASILINVFGWKIYITNGQSSLYNNAAILFYVCIIILFMSRSNLNAKFARDSNHHFRFLRDNFRGRKNTNEGY